MFASVYGAVMQGMTPRFVRVEADLSDGLPGLHLIGDLSAEVRESGARIRTALRNSGISIPARKIVINLAPANLHKRGAALDLAIAAAITTAAGSVPDRRQKGILLLGEVGLNGSISAVPGVLPIVRAAREAGFESCILPVSNYREAALIPGIGLIGVDCLQEVWEFLRYGTLPTKPESPEILPPEAEQADFADVIGQERLKRAALIAAAGLHNLLITGPPGTGKTMCAVRIPTIMPPMTRDEELEVTSIYSVAGMLPQGSPLITQRPYRSPHHTVTAAGLIGGGAVPMPGEISLVHKGVLFLDELTEFKRPVLELLRQPLEEHIVHLTRAGGSYSYPADFLLVCAMNPCPCGFYPDMRKCRCSEQDIKRYQSRISGPFLDRIDLAVAASRVPYKNLIGAASCSSKETPGWDSSSSMREAVIRARELQAVRYRQESYYCNGRVPARDLHRYCKLSGEASALLEDFYEKQELSARSCHRIQRVARTIADLDGSILIEEKHLAEALGLRIPDPESGV